MKNITAKELRQMWFDFWRANGHAIISSASLIPENDPTVLFTTAGMHPLVPYLLGEKHPAGNRLADVQKCVRTGDIDEVGDASHCTFFEMLGNWSLGDYFKKEMIPWSYEFLTSPEYLGIDPSRLAVSVFAGDDDCPRDTEAAELWEKAGIARDHIFFLPKENNWWAPQASPVRAVPIPKCLSTTVSPNAASIVRPLATAANISKSGTTCLCSSIKPSTANTNRSNRKTSTPVWDWNVLSA